MQRPIVCVSGKGGVGKTAIAQAIALALSWSGKKTLLISFRDPILAPGDLKPLGPHLAHLNCEPNLAFEEYAALKVGNGPLARLFTQNKLVRYLSKAAPGIHELVLLGKVWHERLKNERVIVDMPSTGYGLAMFQATENFANLFHGGPIHRDADAMLASFRDPKQTGQLIIALPEEMPLIEALELDGELIRRFPKNIPGFVVNRRFPSRLSLKELESETPDDWPNPVAKTEAEYARKRAILEHYNLRIWRDLGIQAEEFPFVPVSATQTSDPAALAGRLAEVIQGLQK